MISKGEKLSKITNAFSREFKKFQGNVRCSVRKIKERRYKTEFENH